MSEPLDILHVNMILWVMYSHSWCHVATQLITTRHMGLVDADNLHFGTTHNQFW